MMQGRQMRRAVACALQHLSYSLLQFQQCMASISGVGGVCTQNPYETYRTGRDLRRRYR
jgi:hypothetical protein